MKLCWEFTNMNVTFAKFLTNGHQPRGKGWLLLPVRVFFPFVTKAMENQGSSPGHIRACRGCCPKLKCWFRSGRSLQIIEDREKRDLERFSVLLRVIQLPSRRAVQRGAWRPEVLVWHPLPASRPAQVDPAIWALISPSLKEVVSLPLSTCPLTSLGPITERGNVCRVPLLFLSRNLFFFSHLHQVVRETESNFFLLKWKSPVPLPGRTFTARPWYPSSGPETKLKSQFQSLFWSC